MFYSSIGRLITRSVAGGKDVHLCFFFCRYQIFHWKQQKCCLQLIIIIIIIINTLFILQKIGQLHEYEKTAGTMVSWYNDWAIELWCMIHTIHVFN